MQVPLIDGGAEVKSYQLYRDVGNPQFFSVANDDDDDDDDEEEEEEEEDDDDDDDDDDDADVFFAIQLFIICFQIPGHLSRTRPVTPRVSTPWPTPPACNFVKVDIHLKRLINQISRYCFFVKLLEKLWAYMCVRFFLGVQMTSAKF